MSIKKRKSSVSDLNSSLSSNKHIRFQEIGSENHGIDNELERVLITPEKRAARTRKRPTKDIRNRIERALFQRLYLLDQYDISAPGDLGRSFSVLGSTGNTYNVNICRFPSCSCPDFGNGNLCKHILFVYLRVLRCPEDSPIICQSALLQDELASLFVPISKTSKTNSSNNRNTAITPPRSNSSFSSSMSSSSTSSSNRSAPIVISLVDSENESETKAETRITRVRSNPTIIDITSSSSSISMPNPIQSNDVEVDIDDDCECPICFEEMKSRKESIEKCTTCKNYLHSDCLKRWLRQSKTCVYCRSPWIPSAPLHIRR